MDINEKFKSSQIICDNHIAYYTIQLWELRDKFDYKEQIVKTIPSTKGTGVLVKYNNIHFIFTAKHVIDDVTPENLLYIRIANEEFVSLVGDVFIRDYGNSYLIDVAFIELDDHIVQLIESIQNLRFCEGENITANYRPPRRDILIAAGYPYSLTKSFDKSENISVKATYKFLNRINLKAYHHYKYDPDIKIGLSLHGQGTTLDDSETIERISPFGMSGGGVWKIGFENFLGEKLTRHHLVGILTNHKNDKYHAMWATNIDQVMFYLCRVYGFDLNLKSAKT